MKNIKNFLEEQRERCTAIILEQTELAELYTENIKEFELFLKKAEDSWEEKFGKCIEDYLNKKISTKEAKKVFEDCLNKV